MLPLTERQHMVLLRVIDHFNATGEPVSSALVASNQELQVSSATIRNVMSELEEMGLLAQPYTSAGRIPTAAGMRLYVNDLHVRQGFAVLDKVKLSRAFDGFADDDIDVMARSAGVLISQLSRLTSIVSIPNLSQSRLRGISLSLVGERRVLVILYTQDGRVFNRLVRVANALDDVHLVQMQNYLCELVRGRTLREVREMVRSELAATESHYRDYIRQALTLGQQALDAAPGADICVEGTLNILDFAELTQDVDRLRDLLRALQEKERVIDVLDRICGATSPRTLIGPEVGWDLGDDFSLIVCGYYRAGEQVGVLGILGPMRMNYARIIPLVDHAARMLSRELDVLA